MRDMQAETGDVRLKGSTAQPDTVPNPLARLSSSTHTLCVCLCPPRPPQEA